MARRARPNLWDGRTWPRACDPVGGRGSSRAPLPPLSSLSSLSNCADPHLTPTRNLELHGLIKGQGPLGGVTTLYGRPFNADKSKLKITNRRPNGKKMCIRHSYIDVQLDGPDIMALQRQTTRVKFLVLWSTNILLVSMFLVKISVGRDFIQMFRRLVGCNPVAVLPKQRVGVFEQNLFQPMEPTWTGTLYVQSSLLSRFERFTDECQVGSHLQFPRKVMSWSQAEHSRLL